MIASKCVRVALLNGEPIYFDSLKLLFQDSDFVVVRSFDQTLDDFEQIQTLRPDIVMTDFRSVSDTENLLSQLEAAEIRLPLLFTRLGPEDPRLADLVALSEFAGFVSRMATVGTLLNALEVVSKGGRFVDPALRNTLEKQEAVENVIEFSNASRNTDRPSTLSGREKEVLYSVALGMSSKEIAGHMDLSCKTVETYKSRAMQKLDLSDRPSLVRHALEHDWFTGLIAELKKDQQATASESVA